MEVYFFELGMVLIVVSLVGLIFKAVRQPLVLAYIVTGFILGPMFLKVIASQDLIRTFSTIGITFLLFLVGLELDLRKLKNIGKASFVTAFGHLIISGLLGFVISRLLGFPLLASLYISLALVFSSTVIVVKLLSEKHDVNSLYGRISLGFLLIQDIFAIITLIVLDALKTNSVHGYMPFLVIFIKAIFLIVIVFVVSTYILPRVFRFIAKQQELLFVLSIAWCFLLAIFSYSLGLSVEIGAFLAGLSLAYLPYSFEIVSRVKSLRDFFLIIFFVALGTQISLNFGDGIITLLSLSLFVLIVQPLIVMGILGFLGYRKRTSFLTGISIAQISEFSLVIIGTGYLLGHISSEIVSLVTIVGTITITFSTYFISLGDKLYNFLKGYLSIFERQDVKEKYTSVEVKVGNHVVVIGCHVMGGRIVETLLSMKKKVLVVDFDPEIICNLNNSNVPCLYGDIEDEDIIERLELGKASMLISTIPSLKDNLHLIHKARRLNPKIKIIIATGETKEAFDLYRAGVNYVILPFVLGGDHSSLILRKIDKDEKQLDYLKDSHLKALKKRAINTVSVF